MSSQATLFAQVSPTLERTIRDANPWWRQERVYGIPKMRRWAFAPLREGLERGLAPVVVLRGPRQVGKTTLLIQVVEDLLGRGVPPRQILCVRFDDLPELRKVESPILELCRWFSESILGKSFHAARAEGTPAYIFLDEVQNLPDWAPQLKQLVDINPVRVFVTGSYALRVEEGQDSLAGRISTIDMGPLLLREIAELRGYGAIPAFLGENGLAPLRRKETWVELARFATQHEPLRRLAFRAFSERGAYPVAQVRVDLPWEQVADFLNETVIQRAIRHDLRMGPRGQKRDEHLLGEVFRLACWYAGQAPGSALYLDEIRRTLNANIGWRRILASLKFLDGTLLVRLIEPLELRLKRRRGAPKLCLCDHALRAAWLQEVVPLAAEDLESSPHLSDLAGHLAESTVGYFLMSIRGLDVAHFPQRAIEPEVDFILTLGEQRIPLEVKYRRAVDFRDTFGLRAFLERAHYNAPFGVLVTLDNARPVDDPQIVCLPLSALLLLK